MRRLLALALASAVLLPLASSACSPSPRAGVPKSSGDALDPSTVPEERREDYALFAQRCSKCHSLSRALDNGHVEDRFWERYVDRMRRQPGSGISPAEVPSILRFLHFWSQAQARAAATPTSKEAP